MFQPQPQPSLLPDDLWGMDLFQFVTSIVLPIQDPVLQTHLDFCDLVVRAEVSARQMLQGEPQIILVRDVSSQMALFKRPALFILHALHKCISSRQGGSKWKFFQSHKHPHGLLCHSHFNLLHSNHLTPHLLGPI